MPWTEQAIFYHIYPLGALDAPKSLDEHQGESNRIRDIAGWADHLIGLGCNAIYLGPVFRSSTHGYDVESYVDLDPRLGSNHDLAETIRMLKDKGIRVVLDAVFNHTGRRFYAFEDIQRHGASSRYRDWYQGLRFDCSNRLGDPFCYDTWADALELPKLNLSNREVRSYLIEQALAWFERFDIDGLRLDAASDMAPDFLSELAEACRRVRPEAWIMGEVVHGDYRLQMQEGRLDSVTNYEGYKGLYSSFNDGNMHEIAYSLTRCFARGGIYEGKALYNFVDNHDVHRIASALDDTRDLHPIYGLLFTMPGLPSIYYGSEYGIAGRRGHDSDGELRPRFSPYEENAGANHDLAASIARFSTLRRELSSLRTGSYREIAVGPRYLVFERSFGSERVIVAVSAEEGPITLNLAEGSGRDELNNEDVSLDSCPVAGKWLRVIRCE